MKIRPRSCIVFFDTFLKNAGSDVTITIRTSIYGSKLSHHSTVTNTQTVAYQNQGAGISTRSSVSLHCIFAPLQQRINISSNHLSYTTQTSRMSILFPYLAAKDDELHKGISAATHIAHIASFPRDRDPRRKGRGLFQFECNGFLLHTRAATCSVSVALCSLTLSPAN